MMAKKAKQESQEEQSARFRRLVQEMVDAGELSPTDAEKRFDLALRKIANNRSDMA
jgi:polyhydroxyalkanoate synthesis regulator phasin